MVDTKPLIPEARYIAPDGKTLFVLPPNTPWKEDSVYFNEQEHRGNLLCPCCDEPVTFRHGTKSTAGSTFGGRRGHFALFPGGHHRLGCEIEASAQYQRRPSIDKSKGYRIHLNTRHYSNAFNEETGVYGRGPDGRTIILDPDFRDREIYRLKSVHDLVTLLERGENTRLNDSKLVFRNEVLKWDEFFIRASVDNKHPRFIDLLNRLERNKKRETYCAMVVRTDKSLMASPKHPFLTFSSIPIARDNGIFESIRPEVFVRDADNYQLRSMFYKAGSYLIMGVPRHSVYDGRDGRTHTIKITLDSLDAAVRFDIRETARIAKERAAKIGDKAGENRPVGP